MKKIDLDSYPCVGVRGNTWWQFTHDGETLGVSLDGKNRPSVYGLEEQVVELPLHGEISATGLSIVDAAGQVLVAKATT